MLTINNRIAPAFYRLIEGEGINAEGHISYLASVVSSVDDLVRLGGWYFGGGDGRVERSGNA